MVENIKTGYNCIIGKNVKFGLNVELSHNCIIEDNVTIGDDVYVDNNVIIRNNVVVGNGSYIGANCIIGEYGKKDQQNKTEGLNIGDNALIRSGSIIYTGATIGKNFQTGHQVNIRERSIIGDNVSVGTLSDIQGDCQIGNYVRIHSNVFVASLSILEDFVWLFPNVILANDPTPPSENLVGVHIHSYAIVSAGAIILPGIVINEDSLIAAGAIVTKDVEKYEVVAGNPAKVISKVQNIRNKITGEKVYPWRYYFKKYMPWSESDFNVWYQSLNIDDGLKSGLTIQ